MVLLHAPHGLHGFARGFRGDGVTDENDRAHGREAERESSADAEAEGTPGMRGSQ